MSQIIPQTMWDPYNHAFYTIDIVYLQNITKNQEKYVITGHKNSKAKYSQTGCIMAFTKYGHHFPPKNH